MSMTSKRYFTPRMLADADESKTQTRLLFSNAERLNDSYSRTNEEIVYDSNVRTRLIVLNSIVSRQER